MLNTDSTSLNKYISDTGECSRREADKLIKEGVVTINGKVAKLGNRVSMGDIVMIGSKTLASIKNTTYIAFNKPAGVVSTTDLREPNNIISFVNHDQRLFPIGRLDKDSEGLIFLTNDGNIVNKILRSGNNHDKEYVVTVKRPVTESFIQKMSNGLPILGTMTHKCTVERVSKKSFRIVLTQGLNRQIRRMCQYLDYDVTALKRTRIMNVYLGKLKPGSWRLLTKREMDNINEMIASSSKTAEASIDLGKIKTNKRVNKSRRKPSSERKPFGKSATNKKHFSTEKPGTKTSSKKSTFKSNRRKIRKTR